MFMYIYICIYTCIYIAHMHILPSSKREANVYADVHNICLTYTPAHAWCSTTPVNACILSAKMHMDSYIYIYIYIYTCTNIYVYVHT